jgi:hypothetical protein
MKLGTFEVSSGKITVSDPCYTVAVWCMGTFPAKNAPWLAEIEQSDEGAWGIRVKSLTVRHSDRSTANPEKLTDIDAGSYDVYVKENEAGEAVAARVVFITDGEDEED